MDRTNYASPAGLIAGTIATIVFIAMVAMANDIGITIADGIRAVLP